MYCRSVRKSIRPGYTYNRSVKKSIRPGYMYSRSVRKSIRPGYTYSRSVRKSIRSGYTYSRSVRKRLIWLTAATCFTNTSTFCRNTSGLWSYKRFMLIRCFLMITNASSNFNL